MAFWSGETLAERLPYGLVEPFDPDSIDCAAYTMHLGAEVFVTSSRATGGPKDGLKIILKKNGTFRIPPGQFAYLLTEEKVTVPDDAVAFISIKTSEKFRGLVNVSGFHVDPGWKGHLMFGIYNAGPAHVHLRRGQKMFLIWYAHLDRPTNKLYENRGNKGQPHIPEENINNMSGQLYSPQVLAGQLDGLRSQLRVIQTVAIGLVGTFIVSNVKHWLDTREPAIPNTASVPGQTPNSVVPRPSTSLIAPNVDGTNGAQQPSATTHETRNQAESAQKVERQREPGKPNEHPSPK